MAPLRTSLTPVAGTPVDARVPMLGASGAVAAVLGSYFVLVPDSRILTIGGVFLLRIRAWVFLGVWFFYQLLEAHLGVYSAHHGCTAFVAHIGGFLLGVAVATALVATPDRQRQSRRLAAG